MAVELKDVLELACEAIVVAMIICAAVIGYCY